MNARAWLIAWSLLGLAACAALGCVTPQPVPPPPGPFASAIIDCASPEVAQQSVAVEADVRKCLVGTATTACLDGLYPQSTVNAVACTVRTLGETSNLRVNAGRPWPDDSTIDAAARSWLTLQHLGFRSTRP